MVPDTTLPHLTSTGNTCTATTIVQSVLQVPQVQEQLAAHVGGQLCNTLCMLCVLHQLQASVYPLGSRSSTTHTNAEPVQHRWFNSKVPPCAHLFTRCLT
jgi:hypothetical protein